MGTRGVIARPEGEGFSEESGLSLAIETALLVLIIAAVVVVVPLLLAAKVAG